MVLALQGVLGVCVIQMLKWMLPKSNYASVETLAHTCRKESRCGLRVFTVRALPMNLADGSRTLITQ
jgi:hypothetical protein